MRLLAVVAAALIIAVGATSIAVAGKPLRIRITSEKIVDNTVKSKDIRNHTVKWADLSRALQARISKGGQPGKDGVPANVDINKLVKAVLAAMTEPDDPGDPAPPDTPTEPPADTNPDDDTPLGGGWYEDSNGEQWLDCGDPAVSAEDKAAFCS